MRTTSFPQATVLVLLFAVAPLAAQTITSYDELTFATRNASMWGPEGAVSKSFQVYLLNEEFAPRHLRFVDGARIPNPEYLVWKTAYEAGIASGLTPAEVIGGRQALTAGWIAWKATYDGLREMGWTDSEARNGKTACVTSPVWLAWKTCMETFNSTTVCGSEPEKYSSCTTLPGAGPEPTKYETVFAGIGEAPPETFPAGTGIELDISNARIIGGFEGDFGILNGGVDATYSARSSIQVSDRSVLPGQTVSLQTEKLWSAPPTLATNITLMEARVGTFMRSSAKLDFRVFQTGATLFDETILDFDTGMLHQEIAGMKVQAASDQVLELRFFGQNVFSNALPDQSYNLNFPFLIPFPYSVFLGFPMADVSLFVPDMRTPPHTRIDGAKVRNAQLPIERNIIAVVGTVAGADKIRVDVAKVDVDFDVATVLAGWPQSPIPLGVQAGVPVLAQVEVNVEDWDAGAFFSLAQDMSFEATRIEVRFHFSKPVGIRGSAGDVSWVSERSVGLGETLEFEHPGGTVVVTPEYLLSGNEFHNRTDLVISPVQTTIFLQIRFMGLLLAGLGAPSDYTVYQGTLPLWAPIHAATVYDAKYALNGFNRVMGAPITVYGSVPPISRAGADQVVHARTVVTLDGSGSADPDDNLPLSYEWRFLSKPAGSGTLLSGGGTVKPTFRPDLVGEYVVRLVVTDSVGFAGEPDEVIVRAVNTPPVARAGENQTVVEGDTVFLAGRGSTDADADPLTWSWWIVTKPAGSGAAIDDAAASEPSFVADLPGQYVVRLVVHDGLASSEPDEMTVAATPLVIAVKGTIGAMIGTTNGLDDKAFRNANNRKALVSKLEAILKQIDEGAYAQALDKLSNDVFAKMDGYPTSGAVEETDWIVDAEAQRVLYELYRKGRLYLTRLL